MHLLSVRIQWMTFMKILMATTQTDKKILISFDDMIADIMINRKLQDIKELFITCNKPKYPLVFTTQSYFSVPKDARLNSTHYLVVKINNKRELQNIAINYSADIDHKDFVKIYRECSKKIYFRTTDTTLPASDHLRFRKKCFTLIKTTETDLLLQKKYEEALKNYKKLWEETKKQIEVINNDEPIEYRKDFMKIDFESDGDLS